MRRKGREKMWIWVEGFLEMVDDDGDRVSVMTVRGRTARSTDGEASQGARAMRMMDGGRTPIWETTLADREGLAVPQRGGLYHHSSLIPCFKFTHLSHPNSLINIQFTQILRSPCIHHPSQTLSPFAQTGEFAMRSVWKV